LESRSRTGVSACSTDEKTAALTTLSIKVLWNDLEYSGVLTLVSRSFLPLGKFVNRETHSRQLDRACRGCPVHFLRKHSRDGGRFSAEARLWDLKNPQNREVKPPSALYRTEDSEDGARLAASPVRRWDYRSNRCGLKGIARTKIAFVSDRSGSRKST